MYLEGAEWAHGEPGRTQGWAAAARRSPGPTGAAVGGPEVTTTLLSSCVPILRCRLPHTHTRPFSSGPPWQGGPSWGRAFAQPPCPGPCTLTQAGSSTSPSQLCGREPGSWSQGLSLVTSPQDPAALTETPSPTDPGRGSGWVPLLLLRVWVQPSCQVPLSQPLSPGGRECACVRAELLFHIANVNK